MTLVLWDLDGTLLRAGAPARDAFTAAFLAVAGRPPTRRAGGISFAGRLDPWIAGQVCRAEGLDAEAEAALLVQLPVELAARRDRLAQEGVVLPHARETLAGLAAAGWHQGVVTGNLRATAHTKVSALGLGEHLDLEASAYGDDGPTRGALVPIALSRAGRDAAGAWVVGDTPHDLACARASGVRCLLVATGGHSHDELAALEPDAVLPDLQGALAVLTGSSP
ncbi:MAG: family hydrolase [Frankiales bacterium]|nr:family hydrolase [Frankiales bacterium]